MTDASARPFGSCIYSIPCLADLLSYRELFVYSLEDYASVAVFFAVCFLLLRQSFGLTKHCMLKSNLVSQVCLQERTGMKLETFVRSVDRKHACSVILRRCFKLHCSNGVAACASTSASDSRTKSYWANLNGAPLGMPRLAACSGSWTSFKVYFRWSSAKGMLGECTWESDARSRAIS